MMSRSSISTIHRARNHYWTEIASQL